MRVTDSSSRLALWSSVRGRATPALQRTALESPAETNPIKGTPADLIGARGKKSGVFLLHSSSLSQVNFQKGVLVRHWGYSTYYS